MHITLERCVCVCVCMCVCVCVCVCAGGGVVPTMSLDASEFLFFDSAKAENF